MSGHRFLYQYIFDWQNLHVKCKIDREFDEIEALEDLSRFNHAARRAWAIKLLHKYVGNSDELYAITSTGRPAHNSHHILSSSDFSCSFGTEVLNHLSPTVRLQISYNEDSIQLDIQVPFLI